ncbi:MAG: hypothetical protein ABJG41_03510 [Cyclobacteriaceae bacterium]
MKFFLVLLFVSSVLVAGAQITLVPYDEPGKSGTKSIVFEYVDEETCDKVKKEFDIQANNPMSKRGYQKREEKRSSIIYSPTSAQMKAYLKEIKLPENFDIPYEDVSASAWSWVYKNNSYASVVYISGLSSGNEPIEITRSSDLFVLDNKGDEVIRLEKLPYDVFDMVISESGRYLTYLKGSSGAHTLFDAVPGLIIRKVDDSSIHFESDMTVRSVNSSNGWTFIGTFEDRNYRVLLMDELTGNIFYKDFPQPYPTIDEVGENRIVKITNQDGSQEEIGVGSFNRLK